MREADGNKRLRWAFGVALLLHAAALGAAARLPDAVGSLNGNFGEIRVFGPSAPAFVSRVELVEWPVEAASGDAAIQLANADLVAAQPEPAVQEAPEQAPRVQPPSREPARPDPRPVDPTREPAQPVLVTPVPPEPDVAPAEEPGQAGDGVVPGGGGGGGGGFVALGSSSPNGTVAAAVGGETPLGQVPGEGAGSGPGVGPGSGGGTGGGSEGGTGSGEGTGVAGSGFTSRVADRREPEVIQKGSLEYPASAVTDGVEGTVRLRVLVGEAGDVLEVEVTESSGDRRLDIAAEEFVRAWHYRPAVQDGQPRRVHTYAKVTFELT